MKAVIAERYGSPDVLQIKNVEKPTPKSNELLIKISATSITAASTFMREGKPYFGRLFLGLTKPKVKTPGTDLSGIIEAVGAEVTNFKPGDQVMAETGLNCGAYAEYICIPSDELVVLQPENVRPEEATGINFGSLRGFFESTAPGQLGMSEEEKEFVISEYHQELSKKAINFPLFF